MKPILQALLIADHVYEDRATRKKIIAGVFNGITLTQPNVSVSVDESGKQKTKITSPGLSGSPYAYLNLTELHGTQNFQLRFVSLRNHAVMLSTNISVTSKSPLNMAEVILPLPMLPITGPGAFAVELVWNDEVIGAFRITATAEEASEGRSDD
jgi:hypothetical protein